MPGEEVQRWLDALPEAAVGVAADGGLEWANRAAEELFGRRAADHRGASILDFVHPADHELAALALRSVLDKPLGTLLELRLRTAGGWRLVELIAANHLDDPAVGCLVMTMRDLTERRRWEVGRGDDGALRAIVHHAPAVMVLLDPAGRVVATSAAASRMLGLDPERIEGVPLADLVDPADREALLDALEASARAVDPATPVTVEVGIVGGDGVAVPYELALAGLGDDPTLAGTVVSGHNVTRLRMTQRALADLALKDPLTMLPNRIAATDRVDALLARGAPLVVAFVDLDGFKALNDRHGHATGDRVLRAVGERLCSVVRPGDLVARYGGDEYLVVSDGMGEGELAGRLEGAFTDPLPLGLGGAHISASIGVAAAAPGDTPSTLVERADEAMYRVKVGSSPERRAAGDQRP